MGAWTRANRCGCWAGPDEQMQMLGGRSGTRTELDNLTAEMEPEVDEAPELDVEDIPF